MTLIFGMGMGPIGVLCSDTRMNLQAADGTWKRNDTGIQRFALRDGSVLEVPRENRKLREVACGWVAASSTSYLLSEAIFGALSRREASDPSEVYRTGAHVVEDQADDLRRELSDPDPYDKVNLIYLFADGRGFRVGHCVIGQDAQPGQVSDYALSLPDDFNESVLQRVTEKVQQALFIPGDAAGLWQLARTLGEIVHCVHGASQTVSDHMDLVMTVRDAGDDLMVLEWHGRSSQIRKADDTTISAQMTVSNMTGTKHGA